MREDTDHDKLIRVEEKIEQNFKYTTQSIADIKDSINSISTDLKIFTTKYLVERENLSQMITNLTIQYDASKNSDSLNNARVRGSYVWIGTIASIISVLVYIIFQLLSKKG